MPIVEEIGVMKLSYKGEHLATTLYFLDEDGDGGVATAIDDDVSKELVAQLILSGAVALLEPALRVKLLVIIEILKAKTNSALDDDLPF